MTKRLEYGPLMQIALRGLDAEGARRVETWFKYLERWDTDPRVREIPCRCPAMRAYLSL
jgi:hypothetical protein